MADFVEQSNTKTAVRELPVPIADITTFNTLVAGVVTGNPWGCTAYEVAGVPQDPVAISRESYTAKVIYQDGEAKTIGTASAKCPTVAAFNTAAANMLANAALATAMGGTVARDEEAETYAEVSCFHRFLGQPVQLLVRENTGIKPVDYPLIENSGGLFP